MPLGRERAPWRTPGQREYRWRSPYLFLAIIVLGVIIAVSLSSMQTGMITGDGQSLSGPCDGVSCQDTIIECPDGYESSCQNACDIGTGQCTSCEPSCDGHGGTCEPECGTCQEPDPETCECLDISPCIGNGVCELDEYPSGDCPDCNDGNECTVDTYNYGTGKCEHDEMCRPSVVITDIHYLAENPDEPNDEWVEVKNTGQEDVDMYAWILMDDAGHEYSFPVFVLYSNKTVRIYTGTGFDDIEGLHMSYGSQIWNNNGDTATLMDEKRTVVDVYTYTGE